MITPEIKWLNFLQSKQLWNGPKEKTIILTPHPDDETLGAGGLIRDLCQKNIEVLVIAITDGENAYPQVKDLNKIRQQEQEEALHLLGVAKENIIRLRLTDSSVNLIEDELEQLLLPFINEKDHLLAPWLSDYHADHEAVGRVALKIAQRKKIYLGFYFFWTWHYSTINSLHSLPLGIYPLNDETYNLKQKALRCYASQYSEEYGKAVLTPNFLVPALRSYEVYYPYGQ
ncbi:PIG-L deacetylase family protein [Legionella rowbothamii]|uniref:PIG-L deacetylase family protein n=1 Tax=Legionella rowbothamii TaxID=96229 RepID=UPI0013EFC375|nr:PIG-L family deacetylase [Legionella rowbothamii]